jgi:uncharacterized protein YecE (DUF72 family)
MDFPHRRAWQDTAVAGTLFLGTSGFAYPEWAGPFYPGDIEPDAMLPYYAGRFRSVEINYTFRRFPAEKTVRRWAERTPDEFRFALKANQRITHRLRLRDAERDVGDFIDRVRLLGAHLGPILFQCPPTLRFDRGLIDSFLAYLPPIAPYAMEFRHESWAEARPLLAEHGVAWCFAETDDTAADAEPILSAPFSYLRLRRDEYSDEQLAGWARAIEGALEADRDVYAYLKHEEGAAAPKHAERLAKLVAGD